MRYGAAACVMALACTAPPTASPPAAPATTSPETSSPIEPGPGRGERDELVDVGGGLKLHLRCEGEGAPPVVFDAGLGLEGSGYWFDVAPVAKRIAKLTRACAYDRASRGRSDPARQPHGQRQMARELAALLESAGEAAPYVLVGHSMGGTIVQLLLAEHPARVAGMLLIDASPEPPPLADVPREARADFERNIAVLEGLDVPTLLQGFEDLRASSRSLEDKPLLVVAAGRILGARSFGDDVAAQHLARVQEAQRPLTALSTNSLFVIAEGSTHDVPQEDPELVEKAVIAVLTSARDGSRLAL